MQFLSVVSTETVKVIKILHHARQGRMYPGPWFNIKMTSYQYRKSHCGDKTILRPSYLHNGISYTGEMTSLYWIRALHGSLSCQVISSITSDGIDLVLWEYWGHAPELLVCKLWVDIHSQTKQWHFNKGQILSQKNYIHIWIMLSLSRNSDRIASAHRALSFIILVHCKLIASNTAAHRYVMVSYPHVC